MSMQCNPLEFQMKRNRSAWRTYKHTTSRHHSALNSKLRRTLSRKKSIAPERGNWHTFQNPALTLQYHVDDKQTKTHSLLCKHCLFSGVSQYYQCYYRDCPTPDAIGSSCQCVGILSFLQPWYGNTTQAAPSRLCFVCAVVKIQTCSWFRRRRRHCLLERDRKVVGNLVSNWGNDRRRWRREGRLLRACHNLSTLPCHRNDTWLWSTF